MPSAPAAIRRRSSGNRTPRRRAVSASPGVRRWSGPRRPTPTRRRSTLPSARRTLTAGLLGLLAASGGAGGPYVAAPTGKGIVPWPYGTRGNQGRGAATVYKYGPLPPALAVEVLPTTKRTRVSRKMFPGSHALAGMYEPKLARGPQAHRKMLTPGTGKPFPLPTITPQDVRHLESKGFIFPKKVHDQAQLGHAIIGDRNIPNWAHEPTYRRHVAAMLSKHQPPRNRYSLPTREQLALPAPVQRKLKALENRVKAAAAESTARAATLPWKVAAKARRATGYVFGLPGRAIQAARSTIRNVRARHTAARRRTTRPVS